MQGYLNTVTKFGSTPAPDLCSWIKMFSAETWERIKFCRTRSGLKVFETTITQNFIFELRLAIEILQSRGVNWNVYIQESISEKTNGNDIELYIKVGNGYVFLPTQAKIIYHTPPKFKNLMDGEYKELDHLVQNNTKQQIDLILNYAKAKNGIPCYLFYNYVLGTNIQKTYCNDPVKDYQYGCSIINAHILKNNYCPQLTWNPIPKFSDLHPQYAFPMHVLVCCDWGKKTIDDLKKMMSVENLPYDLNNYSQQDILNQEGWKDIEFDEAAKQITSVSEKQESYSEFSPKFKVILSNEMQILPRKSS